MPSKFIDRDLYLLLDGKINNLKSKDIKNSIKTKSFHQFLIPCSYAFEQFKTIINLWVWVKWDDVIHVSSIRKHQYLILCKNKYSDI